MGINDWLNHPILGSGFENFEFKNRVNIDIDQQQQVIFILQILQYGGLLSLLVDNFNADKRIMMLKSGNKTHTDLVYETKTQLPAVK